MVNWHENYEVHTLLLNPVMLDNFIKQNLKNGVASATPATTLTPSLQHYHFTPSWNDDFKKIIVQACTMIDLSKWAIWACKITIVQKKSPGLLAPSSVEIFNFWTRRAWRLIFCQNDALMSTSFCQSFSFLANLWPAWRIKT